MTDAPEASPVTDWRGTPITEGALVVYGAPVGRSIALVEAEVVGFTKSGRVNLRIIRRAYGGGWTDSKDVVHVGKDRLIVVHELPPTEVPTQAEIVAPKREAKAEQKRIRATHDFPPAYEEEVPESERVGSWHRRRFVYPPCSKCGVADTYGLDKECSA